MTSRAPFTRREFFQLLLCKPFFMMGGLLLVGAALSAATTWLVIQAGRAVANEAFTALWFVWIVAAQSSSYVIGAISWIFAEQAGFGAFGRYLLKFAGINRYSTTLLADPSVRERVEPFLSSETFHLIFDLIYELEDDLKLFFGVVMNAIVLGIEIDSGLPIAFAVVMVLLLGMQWKLRKPVSRAYLENQRMTNRMRAQSFTAWDNIFTGNRYNFRVWSRSFKQRLRDALKAQIKAILIREGLSTAGGIIGLTVVFATMAWIATKDAGNTHLLIALAATLPRQIEMTNDIHSLASGWNDLVAIWTKAGGVADNIVLEPDPKFNDRIKFDRVVLSEGDSTHVCHDLAGAVALIQSKRTGIITVRGRNGAGKSTLLAALKAELQRQAFYLPTADRLSFEFLQSRIAQAQQQIIEEHAKEQDEDDNEQDDGEAEELAAVENDNQRLGFSSGERQIEVLTEVARFTQAPIYLLDEWDANLDAGNRERAAALVDQLAVRARVVEISHRDPGHKKATT
jgi:ABC-type bacteriocin/lantibiotic exporter with double-glycine peptidase domain